MAKAMKFFRDFAVCCVIPVSGQRRRLSGSEYQTSILRPTSGRSSGFGRAVAILNDVVVVGAYRDDTNFTDSGAAHVYRTLDNGTSWSEVATLRASDAADNAYFGGSVALSEDKSDDEINVVVGADYGGGLTSGAAYVFRSVDQGNTWHEVAKLGASDPEAFDNFGDAVAISGDLVVVGAPGKNHGSGYDLVDAGAAYVFLGASSDSDDDDGTTTTTTTWTLVVKLTASDAERSASFGGAVAVSKKNHVIVVGASGDDDDSGIVSSGAAYVYRSLDNGTRWTQAAKLRGIDVERYDHFGRSVAVSDDALIVVGASQHDDGGAVFVFRSVDAGASWDHVAELRASDGRIGDRFGTSVDLSDNLILVGAYHDSDNGTYSGSAYVYSIDGGYWHEVTKLSASDAGDYGYFGWDVALSNNFAVVGTFTRTDQAWTFALPMHLGATGDDGDKSKSSTARIKWGSVVGAVVAAVVLFLVGLVIIVSIAITRRRRPIFFHKRQTTSHHPGDNAEAAATSPPRVLVEIPPSSSL
mmetsp:Transcript_14851/g.48444  ORF Transcript_14851/g.48444 Transcript_14851/m.48444 type:complete len:526 (+) Transcript_14851:8-1585(+)